MWQRRTFHECAEELSVISQDFRAAYTNSFGVEEDRRNEKLQRSSERGVEILRVLALAVRSEEDFRIIPKTNDLVGAVKPSATENDVVFTLMYYRPPYNQAEGFEPLTLREALNKIAHADPTRSGFFANDPVHDLILCGIKGNKIWIAILSIVDLCRVIKSLPDKQINN